MKKLAVAIVGIAFACALTVSAAEGKKKHDLTDEQKAVQKEMCDKYDTNKDGKLDKQERAKMTTEDKAKYDAAFPHQKKAKTQ
jgi:hypothetical protein